MRFTSYAIAITAVLGATTLAAPVANPGTAIEARQDRGDHSNFVADEVAKRQDRPPPASVSDEKTKRQDRPPPASVSDEKTKRQDRPPPPFVSDEKTKRQDRGDHSKFVDDSE